MPTERMRMRPWLEEQINSCQIPGLKWVNKVECTQRWWLTWLIMITKLLKNRSLSVFPPCSWKPWAVLLKPSCCVDHIYANFVMFLGEEDLPDPLDARCSSWLGLGERRSSLHEMGHTYRYAVATSQFLFFITAFKKHICKLHFMIKAWLFVFKIEVWLNAKRCKNVK